MDLLTRESLTNTETDAEDNPTIIFKNIVKYKLTAIYNNNIIAPSKKNVLMGAYLIAVLIL